jgi:hypothetical protein
MTTETVIDPETGKQRIVHTPKPKPVMVMNRDASGTISPGAHTNTVQEDEPPQESRQVRRANARAAEKRIRQHMNEVVLKKNKRRG